MTPTRPSTNSSACFASDRTVIAAPRRAAQEFADQLNGVLNRTVSDSRLSLIELPDDPHTFQLARVVDGQRAPIDLHGSTRRLFVQQTVAVLDGRCRTQSYTYRMQTGEDRNSWLLRWEYHRTPPQPDYAYPPAHVHVRGEFPHGAPTERLHLPTRRVPLELVIWHLIAEWDVQPKTGTWRELLTQSIEALDPL